MSYNEHNDPYAIAAAAGLSFIGYRGDRAPYAVTLTMTGEVWDFDTIEQLREHCSSAVAEQAKANRRAHIEQLREVAELARAEGHAEVADRLEVAATDAEQALADVHQVHGHCAWWCQGARNGDHPDNGTPMHMHGPFCFGRQYGGHGQGPFGEKRRIWLHPSREYFHGTQSTAQIRERNARSDYSVGLFVEYDNDLGILPTLQLTPGEARQLAAELIEIADITSGIDHR